MIQTKWILTLCGTLLVTALLLVRCNQGPTPVTSPPVMPQATAAPAPTPSMSASPATALSNVSCEKGKDTRVLSIVKQANGCDLEYEKHGKKSSAAHSSKDVKYCETRLNKIRKRLETEGYKCQ